MTDYLPDEHAQVLWNEGENGEVTAVCVVDYRDGALQGQLARSYENSNGADTSGWLTHPHPHANPAGLFASLAFRKGFESKAVAIECVREFAQLEGCEWARKMLAVMVHDDS